MRSRNFWYGARVWKRQPLAVVASSTPRSFHASRSSSRSLRIVSAPTSSSNILRSSAIGTGSCAASRAVSSTIFTSFGLSMGQLHVDGRERFRLRDLDQAFPDELEHREEIDDQNRRTAPRVEQLAELGELFDPGRGAPVLVVNFLAVLELERESLIEVTQSESFAPIYVKLAHAQSE